MALNRPSSVTIYALPRAGVINRPEKVSSLSALAAPHFEDLPQGAREMIDSSRMVRDWHQEHEKTAVCAICHRDFVLIRRKGRRAYGCYCIECRTKYNREYRLSRHYRMSLDDYLGMLVAQDGKCAICGELPTDGKRLYVDHDHGTCKVRGLLCANCNTGLGMFGDRPSVLHAAIRYLAAQGDYGKAGSFVS